MLPDLLPTWLPDGMRPAFELACSAAKRRLPPEWDAVWATKKDALETLLSDLADWQDVEDWEIRLLGCDADLLLFYVMKVQRAAALVLSLPDDAWVPAGAVEGWRWMMALRPGEGWLSWFAAPPKGTGIPFWPYSKI